VVENDVDEYVGHCGFGYCKDHEQVLVPGLLRTEDIDKSG